MIKLTCPKNFSDLIRVFNANFRVIFCFLSVGAITAILYFFVFIVLLKLFKLEYHLAVSIAYILSVTFYFFANRNLTFKARDGNKQNQLFKFILTLVLNYSITMFIITLLVNKFNLSPIIGSFIAVIATTGTTFFLSKYWIFKPNNNQTCGVKS